MRLGINSVSSLVAASIYILLLVIISRSRPVTPVRRAFRVYLLAMFIWSITSFVIYSGILEYQIWFRLSVASSFGSTIGIFYFVQMNLTKRKPWARWVYLLGFIAITVCMATNFVVKSAYFDGTRLIFSSNIFISLIFGSGIVILFTSFLQLYSAFKHENDPTHRNRLRYIMVGLASTIAVTLLSLMPLEKFNLLILGKTFTAIIITFAILRVHLMDIEAVLRKSLLYLIPTTIIGASYFLLITLTLNVFEAVSGIELLLISMLVAIISALGAQGLRDRVQAWIDKLFFRERYDSSLMLQRVSQTAATYLEVNMLTNMILDEVVNTLHIEKAAIFLKDNLSKEFRIITHRNLGRNTNIRLQPNHPIVLELVTSEQALSQYDTDILPQFKSLWRQERLVLDRIGAELYIPLQTQGNLIGILAVGNKKSELVYSQDDQSTLFTLANQTAVAIENARLFSVEQTRRKELDSLYTLSRELIATENMKTVLEKVVQHALDSIHVTFARIITRNDDGSYTCQAIYPVMGLEYDLRLGEDEPESVFRHYEQALNSDTPIVVDRNKLTFSYKERKALFLEHVYSLCICPLRISGEPIGILMLGERRHSSREYFDSDKLRLASSISDQASSAIQRTRLHEQLEESFVQTVLALANAIDARDSYTSDHSERLAKLATATAKEMNRKEEEIQAIYWAMHLHDIGKIGIADEILQKPGALNDEEWQLMKRHSEIGAKIIAPVKRMKDVAPLIHAHHEKYDGTGYPLKLRKEEIPLGARILAIVDTYGAITDNRVYRNARNHEEAIVEIKRCIGTQFDPQVAEAFFKAVNKLQNEGEMPQPNRMQIGEVVVN